jgi:hypothetical protein
MSTSEARVGPEQKLSGASTGTENRDQMAQGGKQIGQQQQGQQQSSGFVGGLGDLGVRSGGFAGGGDVSGGVRGTGGGDAASGGTDHISARGGALQADPAFQSRSSTAPEGWNQTDAGKR